MMEDPQWRKFCSSCVRQVRDGATTCPICGGQQFFKGKYQRELEPGGATREATVDEGTPTGSHTFSLTTLFLLMTLICVSLGAIVAAPGLGIPFVVLVVPAFIRTTFATRHTALPSGNWSAGERLAKFAGSLGLMLLIGIAGVIAFQLACWTSCFVVDAAGGGGSYAFITGLWVGGGAGVLAICWLLWKTWPRQAR